MCVGTILNGFAWYGLSSRHLHSTLDWLLERFKRFCLLVYAVIFCGDHHPAVKTQGGRLEQPSRRRSPLGPRPTLITAAASAVCKHVQAWLAPLHVVLLLCLRFGRSPAAALARYISIVNVLGKSDKTWKGCARLLLACVTAGAVRAAWRVLGGLVFVILTGKHPEWKLSMAHVQLAAREVYFGSCT
jgi:hypothetical protein